MDTEDSGDANDTAVSTEAEDSKKAIPESADRGIYSWHILGVWSEFMVPLSLSIF
jgi:hypothetical protein